MLTPQGKNVVVPLRKNRGEKTAEGLDVSFVESKQWFDKHIRQAVEGRPRHDNNVAVVFFNDFTIILF